MRLGFSTNAFVNYDLFSAIQQIAKAGYEGVELVLDIPHAFLPLKEQTVSKIKQCLKENDVLAANLNANTVLGWHDNKKASSFEPSLSNKDPKMRSWRISYTKQAIDLAESLNCPSVCVTSGLLNENNREAELRHFEDSLSILNDYAEQKRTMIAIEYEPGLLIGDSEAVWEAISNFRNVGLNLDTCHAEVAGEDLPTIIQRFNTKIVHTHISDCKDRVHFHLLPGLGCIDFQKFIDTLNKIRYKGFLTSELYTYHETPQDAAAKAFSYLNKLVIR